MSDASTSSSSEYILGRDVNASIRLVFQQWMWQKTFGYRLHPQIEVPQNAAIADVACGTGTWLVELSQELNPEKSATFTGFDINLSQLPGGGMWLPEGVLFESLDITQPLPTHLEGKFDIVNLQFLGFVLGAGGPRFDTVLQNLVKMLKPGGWLQWAELDRANLKFLKAHEGSSTAALEEMFVGRIDDTRIEVGSWVSQLPEHFTTAGLIDATSDQRFSPPHLMAIVQLNVLAGYNEVVAALPEGNEYKARLQASQNALAQDVKSGGACDILMSLAIGRKPLRLDSLKDRVTV